MCSNCKSVYTGSIPVAVPNKIKYLYDIFMEKPNTQLIHSPALVLCSENTRENVFTIDCTKAPIKK